MRHFLFQNKNSVIKQERHLVVSSFPRREVSIHPPPADGAHE